MTEWTDEPDGDGPVEPPEFGAPVDALLAAPELWSEPPAGLADRIMADIEVEAAPFEPLPAPAAPDAARRHLPSVVLGAAAAVLVVFVAVVGFSALDGGGDDEVLAVELTPTGVVPDVSGSVELEQTESGVRIDLAAIGLPRRVDGRFYEAWLRTTGGDLIPVGTFHDGVDVVLWGGVPMEDVEAFSITQEGVDEVDESGAASSGSVVLRAEVPRNP